MEVVNVATILVAVIAAAGAWASQRSASKANLQNTVTTGRVDMEKEAYDRARAFDTETISRQNSEIAELRTDHEACAKTIRSLEEEIRTLRMRINKLERNLDHNLEELLHERLRNTGDTIV